MAAVYSRFYKSVEKDLGMGTGEIGIVKNHFNTVIIIYMSIFNISFPVNLQPADKSSKPSNMKSDFTSTAKDSSPKETINIYVLNLIEAHLRNGIQYLRPEHKKGEEVKVETILPTHIEVEEMLF